MGRIKDRDQAPDLENADAFAITKDSDNKDYWINLTQLGSFIRDWIGIATSTANGLLSFLDKNKLDKLPDTTGANRTLETDGAGQWVWVLKGVQGDMLKSDYDPSGNGNKVKSSEEADELSVNPGNDYVWVTDAGGNQGWVLKSAFNAGTATAIAGTAGNSKVYVTDAGGNQVWIDQSSLFTTATQSNIQSMTWVAETSDATLTEALTTEAIPSQFNIGIGEAYEFIIRSFQKKQDDKTKHRIQQFRGIIMNDSGTTTMLTGVEVDATMEKDTTAGAVSSVITADDANDALKIEAQGIAAEDWDHSYVATFTKVF